MSQSGSGAKIGTREGRGGWVGRARRRGAAVEELQKIDP